MRTSPAPLKYILEATFRSNPAYELVLFDRLLPQDKETLAGLKQDRDLYGILRPRAQGLGIKSVDRDTALLFFTLQVPGKLPSYVSVTLGSSCNEAIARLVLDGVIEIESAAGFNSGAAAYQLIYQDQDQPPLAQDGVLARLSVEALKYAQALDLEDSMTLSARLYFYNRLPVSPYWRRRLPSEDALAEYLDLHPGGASRGILDSHWVSLRPPPNNRGWLCWTSKYKQEAATGRKHYKLYVSPRCEYLREAFRAVLEALTEMQAPAFKVGRDVYGVLRPDKLVAYFSSPAAVTEAARRLQAQLTGMPAHGVPFTSSIDADGLLSWGIDPPRTEALLAWQGPSWRRWITDRLAVALVAAKTASSRTVEPWQFALDRLRLDGIDTATWTLSEQVWDGLIKE